MSPPGIMLTTLGRFGGLRLILKPNASPLLSVHKHARIAAIQRLNLRYSSSSSPSDTEAETTRESFPNMRIKAKTCEEFVKSQKSIYTIPNFLTVSRIAITPAVAYFIYHGMHREALICFGAAALTDLFDGLIARLFKQQTDLGAILDPIADKLLLMTSLVALAHGGILPIWLVRGLVVRDLLLLIFGALVRHHSFTDPPGWKKFFSFQRYPSIGFEPTLLSKCNTALQCCLIVGHLYTTDMIGNSSYDNIAHGIHLICAAMAVGSLAQYAARLVQPQLRARLSRYQGRKK